MKFLIVARQKKNVDVFRTVMIRLLQQGHEVRLAVQGREPGDDARLAERLDSPLFSLVSVPTARGDDWRTHAPLIRRLCDWIQYLGPEYRAADTLRMRVVDRLRAELGMEGDALGDGRIEGIAPAQVERLRDVLARIEESIPSDPLHHEFIVRDRPDAVLVTPGIHFGSVQADIVKSARAAGIPVGMLVFSWDNLSTKGALHVAPDLMFVWNERQRSEAATLHGYPRERVVVVGAPRFDDFYDLKPALSRRQFFAPLRLDAEAPMLLYLCSSRFVAKRELGFVRSWLDAVRGSGDPALRNCNVVVRPHPDIPLLEDDAADIVQWPDLPRAQGWVSRPFSDPRAVVLRTANSNPQSFYECLHHAAAVVGLNTSAELEAGIVGRPVFTVVAADAAVTGQSNTLHFHYLLRENGGFVTSAPDLETHIGQLSDAVAGGQTGSVNASESIKAFVREFLRPRGDRPAAVVLAEELVAKFQGRGIDGQQDGAPNKARPTAQAFAAANVGRTLSGAPLSGWGRHDGHAEKKVRYLRIDYPGSSLRVRATHETRKRRHDGLLALDPETVAWLDTFVQPTDVVYDIGAGLGEYSLIAASHRNATAIAFEPGFATYKRLCEHVLLNDCRQSIVPLPLALSDRTGLFELEYVEVAGEDRHRVLTLSWRQRPYETGSRYVQPVCVETLDDIVVRHGLPRPAHVRMHVPGAADAVARGAAQTLRDPGVKSVLVIAPRREVRQALEEAIGASGFSLIPPTERSERLQRLLFVREAVGARLHR